MISVENRVPNPGQEGRVLITPESGSPFYATLAMADGATQPGTPWNRNTGNLLQADIRNYPIASGQTVTAGQVVDAILPSIASAPIGTVVKINENGSPVNYIVVHHGIPSSMYDASCDGTWVLRQDIYENVVWNSSGVNELVGSTIMATMASMLSLYDPFIQTAIKTVKIPYCVGGGSTTIQSGANGLQCQIFPLSAYELGGTDSDNAYIPNDGAKLDYFKSGTGSSANTQRIAYYNEAPADWLTRSPYTYAENGAWGVSTSGSFSSRSVISSAFGIRNAFILPQNIYINSDGYLSDSSTGEITTSGTPSQAIALQSGSAGDTIPVIFSGVAQLSGVTQGQEITSPGVQGFGAMDGWLSVAPHWFGNTKVIMGSYVGTGSYGESNSVTVTVDMGNVRAFGVIAYRDESTGRFYPTQNVLPILFMESGVKYNVAFCEDIADSIGICSFTFSGSTFSWYSTSSTRDQLNYSGNTYYWVALG